MKIQNMIIMLVLVAVLIFIVPAKLPGLVAPLFGATVPDKYIATDKEKEEYLTMRTVEPDGDIYAYLEDGYFYKSVPEIEAGSKANLDVRIRFWQTLNKDMENKLGSFMKIKKDEYDNECWPAENEECKDVKVYIDGEYIVIKNLPRTTETRSQGADPRDTRPVTEFEDTYYNIYFSIQEGTSPHTLPLNPRTGVVAFKVVS